MKNISIDALNVHLFETIEMLKNNQDANASDNEKIPVESAKAIAEIGKVIIDGYKLKAQLLKIVADGDFADTMPAIVQHVGILDSPK
jgi:hypothetical protein